MRLIRRIMLTLALAVSAFVLVPAGTANAVLLDCEEYEFHGRTIWLCPPIVFPEIDWDPEVCPECYLSLDLEIHEIEPEIQEQIRTGLFEILVSLDRAAFAEDPELAEQYRHQAYKTALATSEVMVEYEAKVELQRVGLVDMESGEFHEESIPILQDIGEGMAGGLNELGGLSEKPDIDGAFEQFEHVNELTIELHAR